jgi:hypothetical protein
VRFDRTTAHRCPERRGSPDEGNYIVAVGVEVFGVVPESAKVTGGWPSLK